MWWEVFPDLSTKLLHIAQMDVSVCLHLCKRKPAACCKFWSFYTKYTYRQCQAFVLPGLHPTSEWKNNNFYLTVQRLYDVCLYAQLRSLRSLGPSLLSLSWFLTWLASILERRGRGESKVRCNHLRNSYAQALSSNAAKSYQIILKLQT